MGAQTLICNQKTPISQRTTSTLSGTPSNHKMMGISFSSLRAGQNRPHARSFPCPGLLAVYTESVAAIR